MDSRLFRTATPWYRCVQQLLVRLILPWAVVASAGQAYAGDSSKSVVPKSLTVGGVFEAEWAIETADGKSQKFEQTFQPEAQLDLPEGARVVAIGRIRNDFSDKLEPGYPSQDEISRLSARHSVGRHGDIELRELFLQGDVGNLMYTLGKQQIVWGQSDGLKLLDVVNPQDLREFILDDFDQSRIPLWAVNFEYSRNDSSIQFIWIPDLSFHDLPVAGAAYALTAPRFIPNVAGQLMPAARPGRILADSDAGLRISSFLGGWDVTFNYLYHYQDLPVLHKESGPGGTVLVPRYNRSHLIGGTFSNAFGSFAVRGEVGYSTDRRFITTDAGESDGVTESGELSYVMGVDWTGMRKTMISAQLFQSWLLDHKAGMLVDELESTATLLARRDLLNRTLFAEVMWLQSLNDGDGLLRPKISYEFGDAASIWLGADLFYGTESGVFGQFDGRDRVVLGLRMAF